MLFKQTEPALSVRLSSTVRAHVEAFRRGLDDEGFIQGWNVIIGYRWADGNNDRLPALAADLVNQPVTALAATG